MASTMTLELSPATDIANEPQGPVATSIAPAIDRKGATAFIITAIAGVTIISSFLSGLTTIGLPAIARDLDIPEATLLWPISIYSLTCGCTLILAGAVADVVGSRNVYIFGSFLQTIFTLGCGLSRTSTQLIVFRGFAGLAISCCLPSAVSLIMTYFKAGRSRNLTFAIMGGGQPIGFTVGLTMGGGIIETVGWRVGFYLGTGLNALLFVIAAVGLPRIPISAPMTWSRLRSGIDWVGAFIISSSLALLLYVFSVWTGNIASVRSATSIACLTVGSALLPLFTLWVARQERKGKPVLIKNSLWRNRAFTSICLNVFLVWGSFNATETFLTFLFQDVQGHSATAASLRFLPEPVAGALSNILIGLYVHKVKANLTLIVALVLSSISPLLLAVMSRNSSYWEYSFSAVALLPISSDVLYTVSQLIITAEFSEDTQALAGGVFNTMAQIGKSVGVALSALLASSITSKLKSDTLSHEDRLFEGYQAAWWLCMGWALLCIGITAFGLRGIGKIGIKQD